MDVFTPLFHWDCRPTTRYDNEIFIVRSKTDSSQLNLPHSDIYEKNNDKKLKNKNEKSHK